ncbi:hypothetical protein PGB90_005848 [Kerria lacca]
MSKYELCNVLLKWLQTFQLENTNGSYATLDDVTDGVAMAQVLHQIAPEWFSKDWLSKIKTDVGENWRLKVSNLKKIIGGVTEYYQEYINPRLDFVKPDAIKIGEHKDPSELVKLLQLILGCAVNCNRKQEYIKQIMLMEESVQNVIMQSIQELENLLGSSPLSFSSSLNIDSNLQIEQLVSELQLTAEARDHLSQKYILREDADKVEKLESTLSSYKKKLEELSELKREKKLLEDRNLTYVQQTLELQEELKKANTWKTQAEIYKKQVTELRTNLSEETKKLDKMEFENMKAMEKLNALQKEKERLIIERDSLKEANEELLCNKLQLNENSPDLSITEGGKSNTVSDGMMSTIELKRELVRLQHENKLLKLTQKQSEEQKLPLLQTMYDDQSQQYNELQTNYRQANQRILQLEAELKELSENKNLNNNVLLKELQNQLQMEKTLRISESTEKERLSQEVKRFYEAICAKEQEYEELEDKYRKCLEKARNVAKSFDFPELHSMGEQINILRGKVSDKDNILKDVEKQLKQNKYTKEMEERLVATAFYNFAQKKQQESMDQRLINSNAVSGNVPYLARQRQSAPRRIPLSYNSK